MGEAKSNELIDTALAMLTSPGADTWAAVEYLAAHADALAATNCCNELMQRLYREAKNVPAMLAIGQAGVQFGLTAAARENDARRAEALRSAAKTAAYNLAANTWPGWDEPGITLTDSDRIAGLHAARANLRLARELNKPQIALARAHWMLGAHQLAAGDRAAARESFREASRLAHAADEPVEASSNEAFAQLCQVLDAPQDAEVRQRLAQVLESMRREKDGEFFVAQVETAHRVFAAK